ncbi:hypothetical protein COOONC_14723 [Cooperia oncophora]
MKLKKKEKVKKPEKVSGIQEGAISISLFHEASICLFWFAVLAACLSLLKGNGCICHSDGSKAVALGDYFATSFSNQSSSYTGLHCSELDFHYTCDNIYFHPSDVYELLKHLKPSTSEPYDGIPPIVFRKCASSLSGPLAHIFNVSFMMAEVPELWKEALVTAIPKVLHAQSCASSLSGPLAHIFNVSFMMAEVPELWKEALVTAIPKVLHAQSVGDFRPISLTSTPAKRKTVVLVSQIQNHSTGTTWVPSRRAARLTNLVESVFQWCPDLNQGKCVIHIDYAIDIDLFQAFDIVNHQKLLRILDRLRIRGGLLRTIHGKTSALLKDSQLLRRYALEPLRVFTYKNDMNTTLKEVHTQVKIAKTINTSVTHHLLQTKCTNDTGGEIMLMAHRLLNTSTIQYET